MRNNLALTFFYFVPACTLNLFIQDTSHSSVIEGSTRLHDDAAVEKYRRF